MDGSEIDVGKTNADEGYRWANTFLQFLSDPSPIIGYACQWLTHWLTHSCLVNLIDVTLACEDGNSKFVEVGTVVKRLLRLLMLLDVDA